MYLQYIHRQITYSDTSNYKLSMQSRVESSRVEQWRRGTGRGNIVWREGGLYIYTYKLPTSGLQPYVLVEQSPPVGKVCMYSTIQSRAGRHRCKAIYIQVALFTITPSPVTPPLLYTLYTHVYSIYTSMVMLYVISYTIGTPMSSLRVGVMQPDYIYSTDIPPCAHTA